MIILTDKLQLNDTHSSVEPSDSSHEEKSKNQSEPVPLPQIPQIKVRKKSDSSLKDEEQNRKEQKSANSKKPELKKQDSMKKEPEKHKEDSESKPVKPEQKALERTGSVKVIDTQKDKDKKQEKEQSKKEKQELKKNDSVKKLELKKQESVDTLKVSICTFYFYYMFFSCICRHISMCPLLYLLDINYC